MKKEKVKWQGISLPVPFINDIKEYIKDKKEYSNVPEFVRDAVREKMASTGGFSDAPRGFIDESSLGKLLDVIDEMEDTIKLEKPSLIKHFSKVKPWLIEYRKKHRGQGLPAHIQLVTRKDLEDFKESILEEIRKK
jgi:Arc/MetJ-type ribon-helix-helix transcriptional regulator